MIVKPGENPNDITSYCPISILTTLSKILEKVFLKRLTPIIDESKLIPSHQFGFREQHKTMNKHTDLSIKSTTTWKASATA